jgi:hypothetical protein
MMAQQGILAIFNDAKAGREAEFEEWFQGEHLLERIAVPGFLFGRRHQAISGSCGYFNFYLVESPAVLTSKPYLERLDNPTPMTKKIMSEVFINMNRTLCHRTLRVGGFRGAFAVTARFNDTPDTAALTKLAETLTQDTNAAACEIWTAVDSAGQPVSMEEKLRRGDKKIKACLMVDTLRQADAEKLGARLTKELAGADIGVFRVLCQLGNGGA